MIDRWYRIVIMIALLAASGIFVYHPSYAVSPIFHGEAGDLEKIERVEPYRPPDVPFMDKDGKEYSLEEMEGTMIVLNFWAPWSTHSIFELPTLNRLQYNWRRNQFLVLAVHTTVKKISPKTTKKIEAFYAKYELNRLGIYHDPRKRLYSAFGFTQTVPISVIIDRDGWVVAHVYGGIEWGNQDVQAFLVKILEEGAEGIVSDAAPLAPAHKASPSGKLMLYVPPMNRPKTPAPKKPRLPIMPEKAVTEVGGRVVPSKVVPAVKEEKKEKVTPPVVSDPQPSTPPVSKPSNQEQKGNLKGLFDGLFDRPGELAEPKVRRSLY